MSASHSKVVVDHESDLSSTKESGPLFWAFCSSRLTFFMKWEFWMILFRAEAIFASSNSNFGKFFPAIDREDFNSSNESTISTSLIHNIAWDGKSEQVVTWFLNLIFHTKNDRGAGNLSNCSSDICCLSCPTKEFCGKSIGIVELIVDGLLANVGIGIVPLFCSSSLAERVSVPVACGTDPRSLCGAPEWIPWGWSRGGSSAFARVSSSTSANSLSSKLSLPEPSLFSLSPPLARLSHRFPFFVFLFLPPPLVMSPISTVLPAWILPNPSQSTLLPSLIICNSVSPPSLIFPLTLLSVSQISSSSPISMIRDLPSNLMQTCFAAVCCSWWNPSKSPDLAFLVWISTSHDCLANLAGVSGMFWVVSPVDKHSLFLGLHASFKVTLSSASCPDSSNSDVTTTISPSISTTAFSRALRNTSHGSAIMFIGLSVTIPTFANSVPTIVLFLLEVELLQIPHVLQRCGVFVHRSDGIIADLLLSSSRSPPSGTLLLPSHRCFPSAPFNRRSATMLNKYGTHALFSSAPSPWVNHESHHARVEVWVKTSVQHLQLKTSARCATRRGQQGYRLHETKSSRIWAELSTQTHHEKSEHIKHTHTPRARYKHITSKIANNIRTNSEYTTNREQTSNKQRTKNERTMHKLQTYHEQTANELRNKLQTQRNREQRTNKLPTNTLWTHNDKTKTHLQHNTYKLRKHSERNEHTTDPVRAHYKHTPSTLRTYSESNEYTPQARYEQTMNKQWTHYGHLANTLWTPHEHATNKLRTQSEHITHTQRTHNKQTTNTIWTHYEHTPNTLLNTIRITHAQTTIKLPADQHTRNKLRTNFVHTTNTWWTHYNQTTKTLTQKPQINCGHTTKKLRTTCEYTTNTLQDSQYTPNTLRTHDQHNTTKPRKNHEKNRTHHERTANKPRTKQEQTVNKPRENLETGEQTTHKLPTHCEQTTSKTTYTLQRHHDKHNKHTASTQRTQYEHTASSQRAKSEEPIEQTTYKIQTNYELTTN